MWSETLRVSRVIEWKWVPALLSSPDISHNTVEEENTLQSMSIKFYLLQKKTFRYPPKYLNCFSNQFLIERIVLSNTSIGSGDWRGEEGWWQWYCTGCGRGEGRKNWFPRLWAAPAIYLLQHIKQKLNKAFYYTLATSASKRSIRRYVITEKAPARPFSGLKAATTAFTFKTILRHYAKRALIPRSLNVKLGPRHKGHKGRLA